MSKTYGQQITATRLLALALPWLIMVFAVFPYGLREGYATGVFAGVVAPLVVNLYLLPLPVVGIGCAFFGFLLPILAFFGMSKYWRERQFWLFWFLYLVILVWDTWLGIRVGKAIGGWTGV